MPPTPSQSHPTKNKIQEIKNSFPPPPPSKKNTPRKCMNFKNIVKQFSKEDNPTPPKRISGKKPRPKPIMTNLSSKSDAKSVTECKNITSHVNSNSRKSEKNSSNNPPAPPPRPSSKIWPWEKSTEKKIWKPKPECHTPAPPPQISSYQQPTAPRLSNPTSKIQILAARIRTYRPANQK